MPSSQYPPHFWVISALNRLSRQRETITVPMTDRSVAGHLCERLKAIPLSRRVWIYPKVRSLQEK